MTARPTVRTLTAKGLLGNSVADFGFRMNDGNDDQLEWRDTYFVLFQQANRPTLTQVEAAITESSRRLKLENLEADEDGMFESVLVHAPQDNAAVEISYEMGDAVIEQMPSWPSSSRAKSGRSSCSRC